MKDKEFGCAMKALRMVIRREWHRMTSRRLYLGVCVVLLLLCLFFMATIFGNGQMENIPVGIVDLDNTATSRNISRRISAAPTFRVTEHFTDEADARRALQQKDIYGYLVIPPRFEQKAVTGTGAENNSAGFLPVSAPAKQRSRRQGQHCSIGRSGRRR